MQKRPALDRVVAVTGALVIALALAGLIVVEARPGPYERDLVPVVLPLDVAGTFRADPGAGTMGPAGVCVPDAPGETCRPPATFLDLRVVGLPVVPSARYVVHVDAPDGPALGTLERVDDAHRLQVDDDRDTSAAELLVVTLETDDGEVWPQEVFVRPVGPPGNARSVDLAGRVDAQLAKGEGTVRVNEIGVFTTSTTTTARLESADIPAGWALHAWLVDETNAMPRHTYLDVLAFDENGVAETEVRVERVPLEAQDRFVVMLLPTGAAPGEAPQGVPWVEARL